MREVIPNTLRIGNAVEARDVSAVLNLGVQVVVDLAMEERPIQLPREIVYCRFPLIDGAGNSAAVLRTAIDATSTLIELSIPTLVACSAGMSRSPAIVAAAISAIEEISLADALQRPTKDQPHDVSAGLLSEIADLAPAEQV